MIQDVATVMWRLLLKSNQTINAPKRFDILKLFAALKQNIFLRGWQYVLL